MVERIAHSLGFDARQGTDETTSQSHVHAVAGVLDVEERVVTTTASAIVSLAAPTTLHTWKLPQTVTARALLNLAATQGVLHGDSTKLAGA
jgi:hypothetical protein